ncbi:hypothetical protein K440DRAFT_20164 [Wilcoxina mikolae CBS 423.85]|nr:hypothetical protein K440DRAFT_20164 [Wilcoxina mikolae CBS 423.85]
MKKEPENVDYWSTSRKIWRSFRSEKFRNFGASLRSQPSRSRHLTALVVAAFDAALCAAHNAIPTLPSPLRTRALSPQSKLKSSRPFKHRRLLLSKPPPRKPM